MIENLAQSSDHDSFTEPTSDAAPCSKDNQENTQIKNEIGDDHLNELNKESNKVLYRAMSNPFVYDPGLNSASTESDTEPTIDNSSNSNNATARTISSDPRLSLSNGQWKTAPLFDSSDQTVDIHTAVQKRYSALCMPVNMTNKMSIQKSRELTMGSGKVNRKHLQKINLYGQKIRVGLGFPTKAPVINNKESKMIEMSDKSFNNLENLIQKIKDENNNLVTSSPNNEDKGEGNSSSKSNSDEEYDDISKNNNISMDHKENWAITGQDISRVTKEIYSTKKHFIEMESSILSDFTNIKTSINQILEDRKEIQKQHRIWLENMKKKIYKTKEETKNIERIPNPSIYTK